ncbi:MAG: metallophosphoesterase [Polyangiaceae bacterium]|nr:metallophosphoesterase [Polyangiaceae bacterium]
MRTLRSRSGAATLFVSICAAGGVVGFARPGLAQQVTYKPYIQPGNAPSLEATDQVVIAWQTDETTPSHKYSVEFEAVGPGIGGSVAPVGRVVDNYLSADPSLPVPPTAYGPHVNYVALIEGLAFDSAYRYRVRGPGLPASGFTATFRTRTRTGHLSFVVDGDEGTFAAPDANLIAREGQSHIVHLLNNTQNIRFPGEEPLPEADFNLNCGDNVYTHGSDGNYRDYWMPVWNSDTDSNETGSPFIRSKLNYVVLGNHDMDAVGVDVNLLGGDGGGPFSHNIDGGDALVYYNQYYYPLNGPAGFDPEFNWNVDSVADNGFFFQFQGKSYTSPAAIAAYRASTLVKTGRGPAEPQIDRMTNYSFDDGNAHFVFLDANPHLFNSLVEPPFTAYPSVLREWLISDLDSSAQAWKFVVFHHPPFDSAVQHLKESQMRTVAKLFEDHGVNVVFNGHSHVYDRAYPIRALATVTAVPTPTGPAAVAIDTAFDGVKDTTPDGVLYVVEGAGGAGLDLGGEEEDPNQDDASDQDDGATGGPASWVDTHLTYATMSAPGSGSGPKITFKFKSRVLSFGQAVIRDNELTFFQISEELQNKSSATADEPTPFGTDVNGSPVNDPLPKTEIDTTTRQVVSPPATGTPALLDKFRITKPDVSRFVHASITAPKVAAPGETVTFNVRVANHGRIPLNGAQVVFTLPEGSELAGTPGDEATVHGRTVVFTIGRLPAQSQTTVPVVVSVPHASGFGVLEANAIVRSSTAQTVLAAPAFSWIE